MITLSRAIYTVSCGFIYLLKWRGMREVVTHMTIVARKVRKVFIQRDESMNNPYLKG